MNVEVVYRCNKGEGVQGSCKAEDATERVRWRVMIDPWRESWKTTCLVSEKHVCVRFEFHFALLTSLWEAWKKIADLVECKTDAYLKSYYLGGTMASTSRSFQLVFLPDFRHALAACGVFWCKQQSAQCAGGSFLWKNISHVHQK